MITAVTGLYLAINGNDSSPPAEPAKKIEATSHACNKSIAYRGMAHCKALYDSEIRQAMLATLTLCRAAGIEWQNIEYQTIISK